MKKLVFTITMAIAGSLASAAIDTREVTFPADEIPATNPRIERRGGMVTHVEVFGGFKEQDDGTVKTVVAETSCEMDAVAAQLWVREARKALGLTVRTWTPLSIKRACGEKWPVVKAALVDADLYEDFIMAQELREDDAAFQQGLAWAKAAYGEEVVEAVLSAAAQQQ